MAARRAVLDRLLDIGELGIGKAAGHAAFEAQVAEIEAP